MPHYQSATMGRIPDTVSTISAPPSKQQTIKLPEPVDLFPYGTIKALGVAQVVLGIFSIGVGVVDQLVINLAFPELSASMLSFSIARSAYPIWMGVVYIVCGIFGVTAASPKIEDRICFKYTFLGFSLVCCLIITTACMALGGAQIYFHYQDVGFQYTQLVPGIAALVALVEFFVAFSSSCICCCCAPIIFEEKNQPSKDTNGLIEWYNTI